MNVFEIIIAMLLAGAVLTLLSHRIGAPYPALVALAGVALALVPGTPELVLDPQLALTLFVAPVLLDAAFDSSQRDLRASWKPVTSLALGAVLLTVAVVAIVARALVPEMPWAAAIALGAIVAPPDAAAATAVLKQLKPPHRLLVILEGESLFNDASALLIYRFALGAVVAGTLSPKEMVPTLLFVTIGSVVLGYVLSRIIVRLLARVDDLATSVVFQFCGCFAIWMLAERLHLSGILTMVVFAMVAARRSETPSSRRIPTYAVWEFAVFVLNVLAFILVGFQLKAIVARVSTETLTEYTLFGVAVCIAAIVARLAWVYVAVALGRWLRRNDASASAASERATILSWRAAAVVGWCGMRGIVTLAAALALPTTTTSTAEFPHRDLILFAAFAVVLGTLVVQGLTLRPLMKLFPLVDDRSVEREVRLARVETLRSALASTADVAGELSGLLRRRYEMMLRRAEAELAGATTSAEQEQIVAGLDAATAAADEATVRGAIRAERARLVALRASGIIGDAAFQRVEQELDAEALDLELLMRRSDLDDAG
jgi:monovalent cation/hydrogen antiporter